MTESPVCEDVLRDLTVTGPYFPRRISLLIGLRGRLHNTSALW
jgi:hypothetical protein